MIEYRFIRRVHLCALLIFLSVIFVPCSDIRFAWADETIPVPNRKPLIIFSVSQELSKTPHLNKESKSWADTIKNYKHEFLEFSIPPVPQPRPFVSSLKPLSEAEARRYRKIFAYQAAGKMSEAQAEITLLRDMRLRGHVLYQRYMHPTAYKTTFEELENWLILYADHPGADKIYSLALRKMPKDFARALTLPLKAKNIARLEEPTMQPARIYVSAKKRNTQERKHLKTFKKKIRDLAYKSHPDEAFNLLIQDNRRALLDEVEFDMLQAKIAESYLYSGALDEAYRLSAQAAQRSGLYVPRAGWVAGLAAWKRGVYKQAAYYFEMPARSPYASGWTASGGAYWAARAHMRAGNPKAVSSWLRRAMNHPRTFYGLVATRSLGRNFDFNWKIPIFTKVYYERLLKEPAGYRAMALVEAGQIARAESELMRMNVTDKALRKALLAYTGYANLPSVALRLGALVSDENGNSYDGALYPYAPWEPVGGYKIDPSLIHAVMRQESRFDTQAQSPSGARGLMQLLPSTASYVAGSKALKRQDGEYKLLNPATNMALGQRYLLNLLGSDRVDGDLLALLIAYNAGPGNLGKWKKLWPEVRDPLLFIELIPSGETRIYVERVLSNYWIYRMREGDKTPTLDAMAAGKPARYAGPLDGEYKLVRK